MDFSTAVEDVGRAVEAAGVATMVVGIALAVGRLLLGSRSADADDRLPSARREIGQAILLGLEVLVAGDIIRTVAVEPTFRSVGVLAAIVLIRTFLSMTIELEVSGRLPWSRQKGQVSEPVSRRTRASTSST